MEMVSQSFILASIINKQFIKRFEFSQAVPIQRATSHDALE